jgi:hypothetical protein
MLQLPLTNYQTQGDLANSANVGMTTLDALFNGYRQHDESEMRFKALQDAEELLKQRKLETVPKQYEAQLAQAKMDPANGYIPSLMEGFKGQNDSQAAAGTLAKGLLPFRQRAEQQSLRTKEVADQQMARLHELDQMVDNPAVPEDMRILAQKQRNILVERLRDMPEHMGKVNLEDVKGMWDLLKAQMTNDGLLERTRISASSKPKKFNEAEYLAELEQRALEGDEVAAALHRSYIQRKQATNPTMNKPGVDVGKLTDGEVPTITPAERANGGVTSKGGGLEAAIMEELKRRQQKK